MSDPVRIEHTSSAATVTIQRPAVNNALNAELIRALHESFDTIAKDPSISTMVLAGDGKSLCAGADINWMREGGTLGSRENVDDLMRLGYMLKALDEMPQTTIARVQGPIFGGGVGLVAACDIAIGSANARFCLSEVKLGIVPGMISPFVQRVIGERAARRYFQSAEVFDSAEAKRIGLLHEVVPPDELDGRILQMLNQLRSAAPNARAVAKRSSKHIAARTIDEALLSEIAELIADLRGRAEAQEGLTAFLEKRKPSWA